MVARIEGGKSGSIPIAKLDRVAAAVGARFDPRLSWNGEALDRLLDAAHAGLVESVVARVGALGWEVAAEVTFAIYGERGSVDVLAWHAATRVILVIEVKSVIPDMQAMLGSLDRKVRLATQIGSSRGWAPVAVARLLAIGESRTARRRVERVATTLLAEYPDRGARIAAWLRSPDVAPPLRGLMFVSSAHPVSNRHRVSRR
jgi:hypothetical protein